MRRKMWRPLAVALVLAMLLTMLSVPAMAGEKTVVDLWIQPWDTFQQEWISEWTEVYNKANENVEIRVTFVPDSAWTEKLKAAQGTGTTPDIWCVNLTNIDKEVKLGSIQPLDTYIDASVFDDLQDNFKAMAEIDGHYYAYPYQVEAGQMLFYRKDLFEAAGLDPECPPKSWAEVIDYAQKLTDDYTYGYQLNTEDWTIGWTSYGMQYNFNGGFCITDNWDKANINNDHYKELIGVFKTLHDLGVVPEAALSDSFSVTPVCEGSVAMMCAGSWNFQLIHDNYPEVADLIGVAPAPNREGDYTKVTSSMGGWALAVDAASDTPREAAEFIGWLLGGDPDIMLDFCTRAGFGKCSVRKSVSEQVLKNDELNQNQWLLTLMNEVVPYGVAEPSFPWDISLEVGQAINRVLVFGQSIDDSLAEAETKINEYITLNNVAGTNPAYRAN